MGKPGMRKIDPQANARYRMWRAMRILRVFTAPDIAASAEADIVNCKSFIGQLAQAGYVRKVTAHSQRELTHARYRLIKDTGPINPRITRSAIFDPNTKEVIQRRGSGGSGEGGEKGGLDGSPAA